MQSARPSAERERRKDTMTSSASTTACAWPNARSTPYWPAHARRAPPPPRANHRDAVGRDRAFHKNRRRGTTPPDATQAAAHARPTTKSRRVGEAVARREPHTTTTP